MLLSCTDTYPMRKKKSRSGILQTEAGRAPGWVAVMNCPSYHEGFLCALKAESISQNGARVAHFCDTLTCDML